MSLLEDIDIYKLFDLLYTLQVFIGVVRIHSSLNFVHG